MCARQASAHPRSIGTPECRSATRIFGHSVKLVSRSFLSFLTIAPYAEARSRRGGFLSAPSLAMYARLYPEVAAPLERLPQPSARGAARKRTAAMGWNTESRRDAD